MLETREPVRAAHELTGWALERGVALAHFAVTQPSLEDIYLELTRSGPAAGAGAGAGAWPGSNPPEEVTT